MFKRLALIMPALAYAAPAIAIDLQSTTVPGRAVPSLSNGEIAINRADRTLFFKKADGTIGRGALLDATPAGRDAVEQSRADTLTVTPSASSAAGSLSRLLNDAPGYAKSGSWGAVQTDLFPNAIRQIQNSNSVTGTFIGDSYEATQIGRYNSGSTAQQGLAPGARRSVLGIANDGKVGSLTNEYPIVAFRNVLDDGTGNATFSKNVTVGSLSTAVSIDGSFGYGGNIVSNLSGAPQAGSADALAPSGVFRTKFLSGTRGIAAGLLVDTLVDGTWSPGSSPEAGQVGVFVSALSRRGGAVFAGGFHGVAETTPGANIQTVELDTIARVSVARKFALVMVDASSSKFDATDTEVSATSGEAIPMSAAARISASAGSAGYKFGILSHMASGGSRPITDSLWRASGFSLPRGLDWHDVAFTDDAIILPRNSGARVNSGNASFRWRGRYDGGQGLDRGSMTVNYEPSTDFKDSTLIGTAMVDLRGGGNVGTIALATGANGSSPTDKLVVTNNASDPISFVVGSSLRQVTVGDPSSCGTNFRCLRVPN